MQLSRRQQTILADMGIPLWSFRAVKQQPVSATQQTAGSTVSAAAETPVVTAELVLVLSETSLEQSAQQLLNAMLKAIAYLPEQTTMVTPAQLQTLDVEQLASKNMLLLGHELPAVFDTDSLGQTGFNHVSCCSLDEMLQTPARKAEAWLALKSFKMMC